MANHGESIPHSSMTHPFHNRRTWLTGLTLIVMATAGVWIASNRRIQSLLDAADQAADNRQWIEVRRSLVPYLRARPNNARARLLNARAFISDNTLTVPANARLALEQLELVSPTSPLSAEALLQRGRLHLLLLLEPGRAEHCFKLALAADPNRSEAHSLLWKLFNLTGRWHLGGDHFWKVFAQSQSSNRPALLRDWYLSEFSPAAACAELDRRWGFLAAGEQPSAEIEVRRLTAFIENEPTWPACHAALALLALQRGVPTDAIEHLRQADALPDAASHPAVIAAHVAVAIERGEASSAQTAFQRWPVSAVEDYEYLKTKALVADEAHRDNRAAVIDYEAALATPPGRSDWTTRNRLAQCLARLGQADRADAERQMSRRIEQLMEPAVHAPLRRALLQPAHPQTVQVMADFYQRLGREQEVNAWNKLAPLLKARPVDP